MMKMRWKRCMVRQHDSSDCAAACLSSVCAFYGRYLPLTEIRAMCGTSVTGTNAQGVTEAAVGLGFRAAAVKAVEKRWEAVSSLDLPVIIHLQKDNGWLHFAVLYRWSSSGAVMMDPQDGKMVKMGKEDFMRQWSGFAVVLSPGEGFVREDRTIDVRKRFTGILKMNLKDILSAMAGAAVYILMGLSVSVYLQRIVDDVLQRGDGALLRWFAYAFCIMLLLIPVIGYLKTIFLVKASLRTDSFLVLGYLRRLLSLPVSFFSMRTSGELHSRIKDAYRIRTFLSERLLMMCICAGTLTVSMVMMFVYNWRLALMVLIYVPLYGLIYGVSERVNRKINRKVIERSADFDSLDVEVISGARSVRYFGWEDVFMKKIGDRYREFQTENFRSGRAGAFFGATTEWVGRVLIFTIMVAGSIMVARRFLTVGELVSFFSMASFFTSPVVSLIESNDEITQAGISAERLFEVMDLPSEGEAGGTARIPEEPRDIVGENVTFAFPGGRRIMDDFSFVLRRGVVNALTGPNGCGKSTLAMMLMCGCHPTGGRITVGETPISGFALKEWRRYVSIAPQCPDLFRGTILENLVPDEEHPDYEKIMKLCEEVGLSRLLECSPEGLMTDVGEGGCRLSGGERQKISLVRALYRDPSILILDEATSSMDEESRDRILALLRDMASQGKNIIMITHDEACLTAADRIIDVNTQKQIINNQQSKKCFYEKE